MMRFLFICSCVLSALLCLAACATWWRGRNHGDAFELTTGDKSHWIFFSGQRIDAGHDSDWPERAGVRHWGYVSPVLPDHTPVGRPESLIFLGGELRHGTSQVFVNPDGTVLRMPPAPVMIFTRPRSPAMRFWSLSLPHWMAAVIFAIAPIVMLTRFYISRIKRRLRRLRKCCPVCGYDLRASLDRCPECGTPGYRNDNECPKF
jgi:hypothetical protein